ncbi:MAG TPA: mechanosensitive ion channel family protein, partial [Thermoplasmata archaeon]
MDLLPTVLQGDAIAILVDWVLPLLGIVLFTAFMLWALAYASRYFEYLKAQESKWFGRDTLDFTRRFLFILWAVLFSVVVLLILQFRSEVARGVLQAVIAHVPAAFVVAFALFVGAVFVRVLRHFAEYLRGETRLRPGVPVAAPALALTELVLKYVIYAVAGVTAFVGGVQALPPQDQVVKDAVSALIRPEQWTSFLIIIAGAVLVGFVLDRIARSVFEDMKKRSKKFNARVLDQVKSASRVAVVLVVGTTALFLILNLVLDPLRLLVFAVGLIALALVVSLAAMGTLQEALAGLNLMMADPFDVGDRVK